jgi:N-acetyl-gamma-glutamyl-phosphate reductase
VLEESSAEDGSDVDAAIVAYPHGAAAPVVAALREQGTKVVDLSADFRLHDLDAYSRWYGEHGAPQLVSEAVYGLTELHREAIAGAGLVANPGCYPTASLLALAPLAAEGLIEDVVIDAKSGVSGAGRAAAEEMAVVKETEDTKPYKVTGHRHTPEIAQELSELAGDGGGADSGVTFVPHLMPYDQGELVSCYVRTTEPLDPARMLAIYEERYREEPFVEISSQPPGVSGVRGTNLCRIHLALNEASGRMLAFASIDNLWKGAASQAIQNLNLMLGLPEGEGIS